MTARREPRKYTVPISNDGKRVTSIELIGPFPLSPEEWTRFEEVLEVLRPGLVEARTEAEPGPEEEPVEPWIPLRGPMVIPDPNGGPGATIDR